MSPTSGAIIQQFQETPFSLNMDTISKVASSPFSWVAKIFKEWVTTDRDMAAAVAAVKALTEVIKVSKANTMMELEREIRAASEILKSCSTALSVASGCELFTRILVKTASDVPDIVECKKRLIETGESYAKQSVVSRQKIGQLADEFIRDGVTVLTHGFSRVVMTVLLNAVNRGKRFSVIVTEARPDDIGYITAKTLQESKVPVKIVMDSAVAYIMDKVDLVLVGAEGIVESGGIINKIGTYQISIIASAFKRPFYVAAESFKFMRLYPLNQSDVNDMGLLLGGSNSAHQQQQQQQANKKSDVNTSLQQVNVDTHVHDYTPPSYITLLFTELGVLTPAAVSDELIKLYY